jgi:two-component system, LytTR family, response regulator
MKSIDQYRVIVVDDEKKALERFKRLITEEENIILIDVFTNPHEAIQFLKTEKVDIVFADIEMPEISGLELADQIAEINPGIDVVFVTAYSQYALQAFQVHAVGYLLKPLEIEDIRKQMNKIIERRELRSNGTKKIKCKIQCLGHFLCYRNDNEFVNWRTAKAEELLGLLLHYRGKPVSKEKIMDALWPDMDPKKASQNLHSNLHYVRDMMKNIGFEDILERNRENYRLNVEYVDCDMLHFMSLIEEISESDHPVDINVLEKVDKLYRGAYFEDKTYEWAESFRQWLQNQFIIIKQKQGKFYKKSEENDKAISVYKAIIHLNPMEEDAYIELADILLNHGDRASAIKYYKTCEKILKEELEVEPSLRFKELLLKAK